LASIDLCDEVLSWGAVNERVALDNPYKLLHGVVEVELDLVGRGGDGFSTSELELLNEVLMSLLGKASALFRIEVDVVDVEGGSSQALDGCGGSSRTSLLIVAAVDPLFELNIDTNLVVLEGDQGDGETRVTAEPELEGDVEGLGWGSCAMRARVGELSTGARVIQSVTLGILHEDEVMSVTNHVIESSNGTRILRELGPDLHPVTILTINALTSNLELNNLDESVTNVVQPSETVEVSRTRNKVYCRKNNLNVCAVHQIGITIDDGSHTLVEVGLSVEGDFNGLHCEVCVSLVENLPEGNLRITGDINILCAITDELKKTTTHIVVLYGKIIFLDALFPREYIIQ